MSLATAASRIAGTLLTFGVLVPLWPTTVHASNGLNLIGFGAESVGMAGADVAVSRDTTALNTNPAGLIQLHTRAFDGYGTVAYALDVRHADVFGNDQGVSNPLVTVSGGGYAKPLGERLTAGVGFFAQGGAGSVYKDLATAFGSRDNLMSLFGVARLTPGAAYRIDDALSIGAGLSLLYATAKQDIFPKTSVFDPAEPARSFFGYKLRDASATAFGAMLGLMYKPAPTLIIGATWTSRVNLPLTGGNLAVNYAALGLGLVSYRSASATGLALPQQVAAGAAWQATPHTLWAVKVAWSDYSSAVRDLTLKASQPDNPLAPPFVASVSKLDWRDQYIFALGLAHDYDSRFVIRAGYNYGRNPVPSATTSPLLNVIGQNHLTAGLGYRASDEWQLSGTIEYVFGNSVTYTNPQLPFGPNARLSTESVAMYLMASRRW